MISFRCLVEKTFTYTKFILAFLKDFAPRSVFRNITDGYTMLYGKNKTEKQKHHKGRQYLFVHIFHPQITILRAVFLNKAHR